MNTRNILQTMVDKLFKQNEPLTNADNQNTEINFSAWQHALEDERLPVALVDLNAFERNLDKIIQAAKDSHKTIRIATKSIRVPDLIQKVLNKGSPFKGVMCYSVEEAAFLHDLGIDDLLIAYPSIQNRDLYTLRNMQKKGANVALVLDSEEHLQKINETLQKIDAESKECLPPLRIVLEMDMSLRYLDGFIHFGVRRSPIRTIDDLEKILYHSKNYSTTKIVGVMAYEAVVAGLPDNNPFNRLLNPIKKWIRTTARTYIDDIRTQIPKAFQAQGLDLEIFNGGGTGSLNYTVNDSSLTEITMGSGLLCSHLFDYYSNLTGSFQFEPSLYFALQATRSSDKNFITCHGGGYIASGPPGWDRMPVPVYPKGLTLTANEACGEVQTPLCRIANDNDSLLGKPIFFRHAKAGELAEHFNEYILFNDANIEERSKTYRGMGKCFL